MQGIGFNNRKETDTTHVLLLAVMFLFGVVACILYFHVAAKLKSIGESVPSLFEPKEVFRTFRKYRDNANQNSWPKWLPQTDWATLVLGAISGFAFVYWRWASSAVIPARSRRAGQNLEHRCNI